MPDSDKETLQARAQLVRLFESAAQIEHPTEHELNFRLALMKKIGVEFKLSEVKSLTITGPENKDSRPPRAGR